MKETKECYGWVERTSHELPRSNQRKGQIQGTKLFVKPEPVDAFEVFFFVLKRHEIIKKIFPRVL
jgi:hypothetical protein